MKLRETIMTEPDAATGIVCWRTHKALPPGLYYVHVCAVETEGVTDCRPQLGNCLVRWSNVRRFVVP